MRLSTLKLLISTSLHHQRFSTEHRCMRVHHLCPGELWREQAYLLSEKPRSTAAFFQELLPSGGGGQRGALLGTRVLLFAVPVGFLWIMRQTKRTILLESNVPVPQDLCRSLDRCPWLFVTRGRRFDTVHSLHYSISQSPEHTLTNWEM